MLEKVGRYAGVKNFKNSLISHKENRKEIIDKRASLNPKNTAVFLTSIFYKIIRKPNSPTIEVFEAKTRRPQKHILLRMDYAFSKWNLRK